MRPALAVLLACTATLFAGCAPRLIPGTDIRDTSDSREILDVIGHYKASLEARNVEGILKLVSKDFFETSGTPEAGDDYDHAGLEQRLQGWEKATRSVRASLEVKDVFVEGDAAQVRYFYDISYQIPGPDDTMQWKRDTDTKEMSLRRIDGAWLIIGGI